MSANVNQQHTTDLFGHGRLLKRKIINVPVNQRVGLNSLDGTASDFNISFVSKPIFFSVKQSSKWLLEKCAFSGIFGSQIFRSIGT